LSFPWKVILPNHPWANSTEGVVTYSETLRTELMQAMVMTGTESIAKVSKTILYSKA